MKNSFQQAKALKQRILQETPPSGLHLITDAQNQDTVKYIKVYFSDLPITKTSISGLSQSKWTTMTPVQRAVIPHALYGRDILASAVTGSGKTLSFLVPAVEKLYREKWTRQDGLGVLIIEPTRELALQVFENLKKFASRHSFSAGVVIGGKDVQFEMKRVGKMNILVGTPGRLLQHFQQSNEFDANQLQVLVIDEADRILDLNFEDDLNQIMEYLPKNRQTMLFSATMTPAIHRLANLSLKNPEKINVIPNSDIATPSKLIQHYTIVELNHKLDLLYSFIKSHLKQKILVFFSSCKQVRFVFESFKKLRPGIPLLEIHGKQKQNKRTAMYYKFLEEKFSVLFATDLAARGLDFPNVTWVVQADCPEDVESYIHRVGRTARYKSKGNGLLLLLPSETAFVDQLQQQGIQMQKVGIASKKTMSIQPALSAFVAESPELKHLAQRCFMSYVRSVFLMPNKQVFNVQELPLKEFSESLGLIGDPQISFVKKSEVEEKKKTKLQKLKEKIKMRKQQQGDLFTVKPAQEFIQTLQAPQPYVSKRKLRKFKEEGYLEGRNIIKFDKEGNPIRKSDLPIIQSQNTGEQDISQKFIEKVIIAQEDDKIREKQRRAEAKEKRKRRKLEED